MSLMIASQLAMAAPTAADRADRAYTNTKKNARAVKNDAKKAARDATGNGSIVKDVRNDVEDTGRDMKDEAHAAKRTAKRHAE